MILSYDFAAILRDPTHKIHEKNYKIQAIGIFLPGQREVDDNIYNCWGATSGLVSQQIISTESYFRKVLSGELLTS